MSSVILFFWKMLGFHQTRSHIVSYRYRDIWHEYRDMKFCPYCSTLVCSMCCVYKISIKSYNRTQHGWVSYTLQQFFQSLGQGRKSLFLLLTADWGKLLSCTLTEACHSVYHNTVNTHTHTHTHTHTQTHRLKPWTHAEHQQRGMTAGAAEGPMTLRKKRGQLRVSERAGVCANI